MLSALLVMPLLAMVLSCDWDEKLPFKRNELDAGLLGFWWRVLPDTAYDLAVWTQALIEFRREGARMWKGMAAKRFSRSGENCISSASARCQIL